MTKFKINIQEMQTLQKFKSFDEYVINQTRDIIYGTMMETFSSMNTKEDKDQ
jgi:hypothetical protein